MFAKISVRPWQVNSSWRHRLGALANDTNTKKVRALQEYAQKQLKSNVADLALAWVIKNSNVSVMLLGASKKSQLEENVKCLELARRLSAQNLADINKILDNQPQPREPVMRTIQKTF